MRETKFHTHKKNRYTHSFAYFNLKVLIQETGTKKILNIYIPSNPLV
jgi:hypothetical protein